MELRSHILVFTAVIFTSFWDDARSQINGECGGTQIGRSGTLQSPNYPANYPVNQVCVWVIITPGSGKNVKLTFDYFDLEPNSVCRYDYVLIRDGSSGSNVMIGKFCGSSKPATITSSGNALWVEFRSDSSETKQGFIARWEVEGSYLPSTLIPDTERIQTERPVTKAPTDPLLCGGDIHGTRGIITTPGYPNNYPVNKKCSWSITVPQERKVRLYFDNFNIENDRSCRYDYLEIRDGRDSRGTFISKLCGKEIPSAVTSTSNVMFLEFSSDSSETEPGFKAEWHATGGPPRTFPPPPTTPYIPETQEPTRLSGECGDITLRGTGGTIRSPNYPYNYPVNKLCSWTIKVESGEYVELEFRAFNIERDFTCRYDYVEIRDGSSDQAALKERLCGDEIPEVMKSTGQALHMVFFSDNSETESGFHATWRAVDDVGRVSPTLPPPVITTKPPSPRDRGCGGKLAAITGVFQSPQYPNNYPMNVMCHWTIEVPQGYRIRLELSAFNLEADSTCRFDYLLIYDGPLVGSRELGRFCGPDGSSRIGPFESTSNAMTVVFNSDSSLTDTGFQAYWYANNGQVITSPATTLTPFTPYRGACGGNFVQPSGDFISPGYPYYYSNNIDCVWVIGVPDNKMIALGFEEFDLEGGDNCRLDYVEVRDGDSQNAPLIGRYCGSTAPMSIKGSSNKFWVRFHSNGFITARGFEATWTTEAQFIKPIDELRTLGDNPQQEPLKECGHSLGLEESRIKDAQFSASSHWMSIHKYGPQRARLNNREWPQGWVADPSDKNPWIKVKLEDLHVITSIATQGYGNPLFSEWVKSYKLSWFDRKQGYVPYQEEGEEKVFRGNTDRDSVVRQLLKVPFTTKEVILHPKTWQGGIGFRMELYGCTLDNCIKPLGMSNGGIKDNQLRVSSAWINQYGRYGASRGRLNITTWPQGWIAGANDRSPWLQIKLGDEYIVTQIATQGFGGALDQWVKAYKLTWLDDKRKWQDYYVKRKNRLTEWKIKKFHANKDKNSIVSHILKNPIRSQFIRIWPLEKHTSFSMRTELYGCPVEQLGRPTLCKRIGNRLIGESRLLSTEGCVWKLSPVSSEGKYVLKFDRFSLKNSDSTCTKDYVEIRNGFTQYAPLIGKYCGNNKPSSVRSSANALWIKYVVSGEAITKVTMTYEFVPSNSQGTGIHPTSGACGFRSIFEGSTLQNNWPGQWPWQVALSLIGHSDQQCSGALIGTQWVLTAAHCFPRFQLSSFWVVQAGVWDPHNKDGNEQGLSAKAIYIHPHYVRTSHRNDIALIYLDTPVKINERVRPICLPKTGDIRPGKRCSVAGWGSSNLTQSTSIPLLSKNLTLLSQWDCNRNANYSRVDANSFCAHGVGDSCFGDAGSPLMCQDESNKWVVTGVSTSSSEGCGLTVKRKVYTKVAAYSQWIETVLASH